MQLNYRITFKAVMLVAGLLLALSLLLALNSGNQAKAYTGDGPSIYGLAPSGTIHTTSASVEVYFEGLIESDTETAYLNGVQLTGCSVTISAPYGHGYYDPTINHLSCPVTGLTQGTYTIDVSARNIADAGWGTSTDTGTFIVDLGIPVADTTAPSISSITPSGYLTSTSANVSAYYSDSGSGINPASVSVAWDGTALASCAVYTDYASCPRTGLPQGSHNINVSVADNTGNVATGTGTVFVDSRTPSAMSGYYPANNSKINTASPTLSFTAYDRLASGYTDPASTSGLKASTIAVTLDGSPASCTVDLGTGATSCATSGLAEGVHSWNYTFKDNAGNTANSTRTFTVDTIAPSISSIVPSGYNNTTNADVAVYYSDTGSGINTASVSVYWMGPDTSLTASCAVYTDYASCPQTGLPQGSHDINVSVADNTGNVATGTSTVFVDNRTPSVMSGYYPASNGIINTASPTISFTAYDRLASGYTDPATTSGLNASTIAVTLDGSPASCTIDALTGAVSCATSGLAEGAHSWTYTFNDNAGNVGTRARAFTVDTTAPAISSIVPSGYINTIDADVAVYYADAGSGINTAAVSVYWSGPDTSLSASCGVYADYASCPQTGLPQGSHLISVSVADKAGNVTTGTSTVFIDSYAPSASSMYPRNNYITTPAAITANLRDSAGPGWPTGSSSGVNYAAPVVVTLDGTVVTGCTIITGTGALSCPIVGTLAEGIHTTVITLDDNAGNHGTSTRTFVIDTSTGKPSISLGAPAARWGSYADYQARILSIDWTISNTGANSAYSVSMTNTSNTSGVTNSGSATASFGTINAGLSTTKTLKYSVPSGVSGWNTVNAATAKDGMGTLYSFGG